MSETPSAWMVARLISRPALGPYGRKHPGLAVEERHTKRILVVGALE